MVVAVATGKIGACCDPMDASVLSYRAPWPVYGISWCNRPHTFRLGVSSFIEEYSNKIQVISLPDRSHEFVRVAEADHQYPVTKLAWIPPKNVNVELMATTGDFLRIWDYRDTHVLGSAGGASLTLKATLANIRKMSTKRDYSAPLTSFDWNSEDPAMIVTCSIDTTCTVWDINTQQAKTQLIAHDKEVYDVAFARGTDIFASVGADGSVRMFDLRSLDHSTIMYETPPHATSQVGAAENPALLRLSWNKQDPNYMATFQVDDNQVILLDVRVPAVPVTHLQGHRANVNAIQWSPSSTDMLCSAGDDSQALVWQVDASAQTKNQPITVPAMVYDAEAEVSSLHWNGAMSDWVGFASGNTVNAVKI
ncbi:WD-repeat protein GhTTG1 [Gonapodya prolifera JEL478]|uniref:WD-repeat protein GhTTG1 n=1 Tax=Gonapodya prolifera (strain JEL478) TaxID=1344416 RepID=A0A139AL14_GONPJ|nr:WD-repeat protein GhTTG1 [Gonapodya prolifera JEL478]|eukprot:KXS17492.1 WD-repeat protein GhTTG1 [Gonapodya prolifera JEL478]